MKYTEWLGEIRPKLTGNGARVDVRLHFYPDGHGNILVTSDGTIEQPVNGPDEAARVLHDLWEKVASAQGSAHATASTDDLDSLLNQITPDNIHKEVETGDPVGGENCQPFWR